MNNLLRAIYVMAQAQLHEFYQHGPRAEPQLETGTVGPFILEPKLEATKKTTNMNNSGEFAELDPAPSDPLGPLNCFMLDRLAAPYLFMLGALFS